MKHYNKMHINDNTIRLTEVSV